MVNAKETLLLNLHRNCWLASDFTAAMLGGQKQKCLSPLGNALYFDANFAQKFLLY